MKYVIMLTFGYPKGEQLRHNLKGFHRRKPEQIADKSDPRQEPARLAPSSMNSQPWYFTHEGNAIHVYCTAKGMVPYMNRIDMGIALAHLYVANPKTFRFFKADHIADLPGYTYIGSVTL